MQIPIGIVAICCDKHVCDRLMTTELFAYMNEFVDINFITYLFRGIFIGLALCRVVTLEIDIVGQSC